MENNERLKEAMYIHRIAQWMLADELGVSEITVYRNLRKPMSEEMYKLYLEAIEKLIREE